MNNEYRWMLKKAAYPIVPSGPKLPTLSRPMLPVGKGSYGGGKAGRGGKGKILAALAALGLGAGTAGALGSSKQDIEIPNIPGQVPGADVSQGYPDRQTEPDPSTLDQLYAMLQGGGGHALGGAGLGYGVSKALGGPGWLGAGLGGLAGYLGKDHINSALGIGGK